MSKRLNAKEVEEALWRAHGNVALAAIYLDVPYNRLHRYLYRGDRENSARLRETLKLIRERVIDLAEQRLIAAALDGKSWALKFFLERQARERGYGEEVVVRSEGGIAVDLKWPLAADEE